MITADQLAAGVGLQLREAHVWIDPLQDALHEFRIRAPLDVAAFVAQCAHESAGFTRLRENMTYSKPDRIYETFRSRFVDAIDAARFVRDPAGLANHVYAGRYGNGPAASGDGYRYRGGGLLHLTFRDQYREAGDAVGVDLETDPELIERPVVAARTAGWYWVARGCQRAMVAGDATFERTTRIINPGMAGAAERRKLFDQIRRAIVA
jgi:putative chitinase